MGVVLVVDDEEEIVRVIGFILSDRGHTVVEAGNGQEALAYLEKGQGTDRLPDLILSDVMMPLMDGLELCRQVRAEPGFSTIPVVLMSAARDPTKLDNVGNAAFLRKPFEIEDLLATVSRVLSSKGSKE
jgi:CheY-like chemotaxis protein